MATRLGGVHSAGVGHWDLAVARAGCESWRKCGEPPPNNGMQLTRSVRARAVRTALAADPGVGQTLRNLEQEEVVGLPRPVQSPSRVQRPISAGHPGVTGLASSEVGKAV